MAEYQDHIEDLENQISELKNGSPIEKSLSIIPVETFDAEVQVKFVESPKILEVEKVVEVVKKVDPLTTQEYLQVKSEHSQMANMLGQAQNQLENYHNQIQDLQAKNTDLSTQIAQNEVWKEN